ncbi:hypothetical protein BC828DRAFT_386937 [Blastocladiella britannica]|nr:hypothetical protein BC828DRAFT_386937 [Blastocladiella britannica]
MTQVNKFDLMPWLLDQYPRTKLLLLALTLSQYAQLVALGREDVIAQLLQLGLAMGRPLALDNPESTNIELHYVLQPLVRTEMLLDYLVDFCDRMGAPFAPASSLFIASTDWRMGM